MSTTVIVCLVVSSFILGMVVCFCLIGNFLMKEFLKGLGW